MKRTTATPFAPHSRRRGADTLRTVTYGALIAAAYVLLTLLSSLFPGNIAGFIRLSEALCVLVIFTPAAVPGLGVGCLLANVICGALPLDVICGTAVTLVAAFIGYLLRKKPFLVPLPTVLFNAFAIPPLLQYVYGIQTGYWLLFAAVAAGEIVSAYVCGLLLHHSLRNVHF